VCDAVDWWCWGNWNLAELGMMERWRDGEARLLYTKRTRLPFRTIRHVASSWPACNC